MLSRSRSLSAKPSVFAHVSDVFRLCFPSRSCSYPSQLQKHPYNDHGETEISLMNWTRCVAVVDGS